MGIKERREREKQQTRQAILTAALQIARLEDWPALTIRKVGEYIEYSAPMVYEYFASKEEILRELLQEGFRQLTAAMRYAAKTASTPGERPYKVADAYWNFAQANPELYRLMFGQAGVPIDRQMVAEATQESCIEVVKVLEDWAQTNGIVLEDAMGASEILWALLHGLISFTLLNRIQGGDARARTLMHQALQHQLLAWQAEKKE